jgi:HD-GYP domain-containing protein (c-di-GMP phosphodiesterase class II)
VEGAATFEALCTLFMTTATRCRLYGVKHPVTRTVGRDFMRHYEQVTGGGRPLKIVVSGDELFVSDQALPLRIGAVGALAKRLSSRGVGFLELRAGLSLDELLAFCAEFADPAGGPVRSQAHIQLGEARYIPKGYVNPIEALRVQEAGGDRRDDVGEEVRELEMLYRHVKEHLEVRVQNFEQLVVAFLSRFAKQFNPLMNLAELKQHHKFTYIHSTNVANLVIGMGMGLGLEKRDIFDLGMAALLHDVGKRFVPDKVLEKPGQLSRDEWDLIQKHPSEGARFLLKQKKVNHLSVVVAFEHHLHYQGGGGYPRCKPPRRPCMASQLVALADSFDALFSQRSYHRRYDIMEALEIINDASGFNYNPWLVDVFNRYITIHMDTFGGEGAAPLQ